jgi:hypothetical protein
MLVEIRTAIHHLWVVEVHEWLVAWFDVAQEEVVFRCQQLLLGKIWVLQCPAIHSKVFALTFVYSRL